MSDIDVYSKSNTREQEKILLQPYVHFRKLNRQVNRYLPRTLKSLNYWMKIPEDKYNIIENVCIMTHHAIVLFDTLKDESIAEKKIPTVHSIYGIPSVINAANYVHFVALERSLELQNAEVLDIFSQRTIEIYKCISQEYEWSDKLYCPSEEEYKKMTSRKSGNGFKAAIDAMQLFSDNKLDFTEICNVMEVFTVLYADLINMCSKKGSFAKLYYNHISGRRYCFPIVHAFNTQPDNMSLFKIFQKKSNVDELQDYFVASLKKIGSFEYTKNILLDLKRKADIEIRKLGGNPCLSNILEEMICDIINISL